MSIDFHYFPRSHWSRAVHLLLREKGMEVQPHLVDIRKNATYEPDYMRMNPRGVVPTLVIDGRVVCNSPHIASTLDALGGPMMVRPENTEWTRRLTDFPLMHLSYSVWVLGQKGERSAEILKDKVDRGQRFAKAHPDLSELYSRKAAFFQAFSDELTNPDRCAQIESQCRSTLADLGNHMTDRAYIGAEFGFADAIAASILWRLVDLPLLDEWNQPEHPLHQYFERLKARPSFQFVWFEDPMLEG